MKVTCLIIDDDAGSRSILKSLIKIDPRLKLIGEVDNPTSGTLEISKNKPQLIFLDLNMPGLSGFEMLDVLDFLPKVILYTSETQIQQSRNEGRVSSYLFKPVNDFVDFRRAVDRALTT